MTRRTRALPAAIRLRCLVCLTMAFLLTVLAPASLPGSRPAAAQAVDTSPPSETIKLIFIHHSSGENWLADEHGGLGQALGANNYFISDTNYGWGPDVIGDRTDIVNWPEWFTGPESGRYLAALYAESGQNSAYTRTLPDPGDENRVVMFKSCFPNSNLEGSPDDPPQRGEGLTVGNAKAIYNELLGYFATRPDKLFVVITAPPVQDKSLAKNARAFNTWLVQDWLAGYGGTNVAVFDYYNVLTDTDNHHRVRDGQIEYITDRGRDTLAYPSPGGDDHPSPKGNHKATDEFVPLLNTFVNRWLAGLAGGQSAAPAVPQPTAAVEATAAPLPRTVIEAPTVAPQAGPPAVAQPTAMPQATSAENEAPARRGICPSAAVLLVMIGGLGVAGARTQR